MKIEFAVNLQWVGKPDPTLHVDLGNNWNTVVDTAENLFKSVSQDGIPICSALVSDNRRRAYFKSAQVVLLDIDNNMTLQQLFKDEFYLKYGCAFWTSPGFKPEHHKFRIMFLLENAITNKSEYQYLIKGLMKIFPADPACKDATRYFNGTIRAKYSDYTGTVLPQSVVDNLVESELLAENKRRDRDTREAHKLIECHQTQTDEEKQAILDALHSLTLNEYARWRNVAIAMYNSGYDLNDLIYITVGGCMAEKSVSDCEKLWRDCKNYDVGYGHIVNVLKQHDALPKRESPLRKLYKSIK